MARTIQEIYDEMVAEKQTFTELNGLQPNIDDAQTLLDDLTATSKVAAWRLYFWVMAVAIFAHEKIFDAHKAEVEALADTLILGTARNLQIQVLAFQFGDTLQFIDGQFKYLVIDESKQIIKRVAIVETGGQVRIKVAKLSGTDPVPLTTTELSAFSSYIDNIKFAGTNVAITSKPADLLKIVFKVVYDPLVLGSNGESIANPGTFPVEDAINGYIKGLPFNGELNLTQLVDAVQLAAGVIDPILQTAEFRFGAIPFAPIVENYLTDAGHAAIDPAHPLSANITYISN